MATENNSVEQKINTPQYVPSKYDLFKWCDEEYWCIEGGSFSGMVNPIGTNDYVRGFIWNYAGENPVFVRKATAEEVQLIQVQESKIFS